jgi:ribosome-associated protein
VTTPSAEWKARRAARAAAETITDAIRAELRGEGVNVLHAEGVAESGWVLLDYGDVLMHVFLEDTRTYYALERLWGDAPTLTLDDS